MFYDLFSHQFEGCIRCTVAWRRNVFEVTNLAKSLKVIINVIEEFVVSNVGKETSVPEQSNVTVSVPVTLPHNNNTPLVHQNKDNEFQIVRNGVKSTQNRNFVSIATYNHFQILQVDEENETQETRS